MCANVGKFLSMMELTSQIYFTFEMKNAPRRIKSERFELEHTANLEISACFLDLSEKKGICAFKRWLSGRISNVRKVFIK